MVNQQYNPNMYLGKLTNNIDLTNDYNPDSMFDRFKIITDPEYVKQYLSESEINNFIHGNETLGIFLAPFAKHPCLCEIAFEGGNLEYKNPDSCFPPGGRAERQTLNLKIWIYLEEIGSETLPNGDYLMLKAFKTFTGNEIDQGIYKGLAFWKKDVENEDCCTGLSKADEKEFLKALKEKTHNSIFELWTDYGKL